MERYLIGPVPKPGSLYRNITHQPQKSNQLMEFHLALRRCKAVFN
jgi:hypothetical protein